MKSYSSTEMQKHNFYRMPKELICDKKYRELSNNAKLLYAIILDRASLSESNAWIDEQNKVVVFLERKKQNHSQPALQKMCVHL